MSLVEDNSVVALHYRNTYVIQIKPIKSYSFQDSSNVPKA